MMTELVDYSGQIDNNLILSLAVWVAEDAAELVFPND